MLNLVADLTDEGTKNRPVVNTLAILPRNLSAPEKEAFRPVRLEFGIDVPLFVRSRMSYAFRVFAAIYGRQVLDQHSPHNDAIVCIYGGGAHAAKRVKKFHIPALYRPSRSAGSLRLQRH